MPADKTLWHYGKLYNKIIDPMMKPSRDIIVALVPQRATVLDIGCGTGKLCFDLRQQKQCQVVGIDLSTRMLAFAQMNNPYEDVKFLHQDATNMEDFEDDSFDYIVVSHFIHELTRFQQLKALKEASRIARNIILLDSHTPLPWNFVGVLKRFFELVFGYDHYAQFNAYLDSGGIMGLLNESDLGMKITHRFIFSSDCQQVAVVSR
jgi:SAM-dependent methyltransferase